MSLVELVLVICYLVGAASIDIKVDGNDMEQSGTLKDWQLELQMVE